MVLSSPRENSRVKTSYTRKLKGCFGAQLDLESLPHLIFCPQKVLPQPQSEIYLLDFLYSHEKVYQNHSINIIVIRIYFFRDFPNMHLSLLCCAEAAGGTEVT